MDLRTERTRLEAALSAGDDSVRIALGGVLQLMGEHGAAIAMLESGVAAARAAAATRLEVEGMIALGVSRQLLGQPDAGITYRSAIALASSLLGEADPLTARAYWELGSMIHDAELIEQAARIWVACAQPAWSIRARAFLAADRVAVGGPASIAFARELYVQALAALDLALGEGNPLLVEVLLEAAEVFEPGPARAMRERAVRIARLTAGLASQRHVDALWALATTTDDISVIDAALAQVDGDDTALAALLYTRAAFLDRALPSTSSLVASAEALHLRERSLRLRENTLGSDAAALVPLVSEIKQGWESIGRLDEAEAFLRRCRERARPEGWAYRNLTYSIGYLLSAQHRRAEYLALVRDFFARRDAACAPDSPELVEALELVVGELPPDDPGALVLAERLVRLRPGAAASRALARAQLAAGLAAEGRATLAAAIDHWIAGLAQGPIDHEPAIAELADALLAAAPPRPPPPSEPVSAAPRASAPALPSPTPPVATDLEPSVEAAFAVHDGAVKRALAIAGEHPGLARAILGRAVFALHHGCLPDPVVFEELERALGLFEQTEGPEGPGVAEVCGAQFEVLERRDLAAARPFLERAIAIHVAHTSAEADSARGRLALALERAGHLDEAVAIRSRLLEVWATDAPERVPAEVLAIVRARTVLPPAETTILDGGTQRELESLEPLIERAHATVDANPEHGVHETVTAWFTLARARRDAGDDAGARRALARMTELARHPQARSLVQAYVDTARDELPALVAEAAGQLAAIDAAVPTAPQLATTSITKGQRVVYDARHGFDRTALSALLDGEPDELAVELAYVEGDYPEQATNAAAVIETIAATTRPTLCALALVQRAVPPDPALATLAGCPHADPRLWDALPRLGRLHLGGFDVVHAIAHPTLAELVLDDRPICTDGRWDVPAVRSIRWSFTGHTTGVATDTDFAVLDPLWTQPLPALREVIVRGSFYDCDTPLSRPEIRARIATLDRIELPASALDDDPIDTLLANVELFRDRVLVVIGLSADPRLERLQRELPRLSCE